MGDVFLSRMARDKKEKKSRANDSLLSALGEYFNRVGRDFMGGLQQSAQGVEDIVERGNVLTGVPRVALGGLGWLGSPVSAAVGPIIEPIAEPIVGAVDEYVSKPVESLTGYPRELTTQLVLATAVPVAGKLFSKAVPYLARAGDEIGARLGPPEGSLLSGAMPMKQAMKAADNQFDDVSFPDEMSIAETADVIEKIAAAHGLHVKRGKSDQSKSEYVTLRRMDDPDAVYDDVKIRIADHDLPSYYSEASYDVWPQGGGGIEGGWLGAIDEAFADLGVSPPSLKTGRATFLNTGPDWQRKIYRERFEAARKRAIKSAKRTE